MTLTRANVCNTLTSNRHGQVSHLASNNSNENPEMVLLNVGSIQ